ncbi:uncharacterized protein LOC124291338 [Haliotis rubra]|uniref:uncharacterized protein LOC124291338 n=1 Tax=Haliotis rubra TaxID=36100 RepID=UPI001EE5A5DE|nr:uncharacterized protein LOC124291338 [Haliotis rubra]
MASSLKENPDIIDDDIQRRVQALLNNKQSHNENQASSTDEEYIDDLEVTLKKVLQAERNHWKEKLQSSMQEIDKQHKMILSAQSELQALADDVGVVPHNDVEDDYSSWGSSKDLVKCLQDYIHELQKAKTETLRDPPPPVVDLKLKSAISSLKKEKTEQLATIASQNNQIRWLQTELNSYKHKVSKYRKIVKNYNEQTSSHFHLDDIETSKKVPNQQIEKQGGERVYVEGEQLTYPNPNDEIASWTQRSNQKGRDAPRGSPRAGISQCLRCQKLFKQNENTKLACRFHKKGREIKEQYDDSGRLCRVVYKWACCKKVLDSPGCSYGFHV